MNNLRIVRMHDFAPASGGCIHNFDNGGQAAPAGLDRPGLVALGLPVSPAGETGRYKKGNARLPVKRAPRADAGSPLSKSNHFFCEKFWNPLNPAKI